MLTQRQMIKLSKRNLALNIFLGFLLVIIVINVPTVKGLTNQFTTIATSFCSTCSNPLTITDTAASTNDLLVITTECYTNFAITGITDTATNSWSDTGASPSVNYDNSQILTTHSGTTTIYTHVWFTKAKTGSASTATITFSAANSNCIYSVYDGNTISTAFSSSFVSSPIYKSTDLTSYSYSITQSIPANSIILTLGYDLIPSNTASLTYTQLVPNGIVASSQLGNAVSLSDGVCASSSCRIWTVAGTFNSLSSINVGLGFIFPLSSNLGGCSGTCFGGLSIFGFIFSITGTITANGSNQVTIGCTTGYQNHNFALPSNATYWFQGNAFGIPSNSFATIINMSVWINSVSLTNSQTSATLWLVMYGQNVYSSNNINLNLPAPGNQYGLGLVVPLAGVTVTNTGTKSHLSIAGITLNIQAGQQYAIGLFATHNGINIATCSTSMPTIYFQNQLNALTPRGPAVNQPYLSGATSTTDNMSISALVNNPSVITLQTVTSTVFTITSFSTITSTTTTGTATQTVTVTTTQITNALQGPTGSALILSNLITYFPIWFLPLVFGFLGGQFGFGLGGLLFGILMGLTLGQLAGLLPLWTIFMNVVMLYLILRR